MTRLSQLPAPTLVGRRIFIIPAIHETLRRALFPGPGRIITTRPIRHGLFTEPVSGDTVALSSATTSTIVSRGKSVHDDVKLPKIPDPDINLFLLYLSSSRLITIRSLLRF